MKSHKIVLRSEESNLNHHIWNNGGIWWCHITIHHKIRTLITLSFGILAYSLQAAPPPNILWMVSEDNGARWLGCYGNPAKPTPTLDKLASQGFRYQRCFASVPVCAPQRFTWITGINAISAGTQGMRSGVQLPDSVRFYPEIFNQLGYYTSKGDDAKTDYNFRGRNANDTWSDSKKINWETLKKKQPFIHVFNTHDTHEWNSFGGYKPDKDKAPKAENLAAYHPDIPEMHFVYEKYNEAHRKMDQRVKGWLEDLEKSGMADNTIVIYSSDHGGVLPRSKRFLYNSGTHCPLIVRIPETLKHLYPAAKPGSTVDELVSFTDFPKTWLSLAGAKAKDLQQMQGRIFLGNNKEKEPNYVYSFRNRMDDRLDMVRSVRDHQYLYIRNYMPFAPVGQYLPYLYNSVSSQAWKRYHHAGKTDAVTGRYFKQPRDIDEIYLYQHDYDNVKNLAADINQSGRIKAMRAALREWQLEIYDAGFIPEDEIGRQAKKHHLTVYEFVRKPELYPLEQYIDMADRSLELDSNNIPTFLRALDNPKLGSRYWATLGILNLSFHGNSVKTPEVIEGMKKLIQNKEESQVTQAYAAWVMVKVGERKDQTMALDFIDRLSRKTYSFRTILNILDWMDPSHSLPIVYDIFLNRKIEKSAVPIILNKLIDNTSSELGELLKTKYELDNRINHHSSRIRQLKLNKKKLSEEEIVKQTAKSQSELARAIQAKRDVTTKLKELKP